MLGNEEEELPPQEEGSSFSTNRGSLIATAGNSLVTRKPNEREKAGPLERMEEKGWLGDQGSNLSSHIQNPSEADDDQE